MHEHVSVYLGLVPPEYLAKKSKNNGNAKFTACTRTCAHAKGCQPVGTCPGSLNVAMKYDHSSRMLCM
jgi:hypothetical protein